MRTLTDISADLTVALAEAQQGLPMSSRDLDRVLSLIAEAVAALAAAG